MCIFTSIRGPEACSNLLQQDRIQGRGELMRDPTGFTGYCENIRILPEIPLWKLIPPVCRPFRPYFIAYIQEPGKTDGLLSTVSPRV
jgi:hypothetical protein